MSELQQPVQLETIISSELANKSKMYSHPKYRFTQLYPITNANQNTTITASGGTEIQFQIPVKTINLSESYLSLSINPPAGGANRGNIFHASPLSFLRHIQLFTQSGVYITDLYYANQYMNTVYFPETSLEDLQTNEIVTSSTVNKWTTLAQQNAALGASVNADYARRVSTDVAGALAATSIADDAIGFSERKYFYTYGDANTATPVINIKIPMSYIKNTIFSMNRDLYFGEVLNLRFVTESYNSVGFICTHPVADVRANNAEFTGNLIMSNVIFFLAVEQDLAISQAIINEMNAGNVNISIPYVYSYKTTNGASTTQTISLRLNRSHGHKLRRIYHAPTHATETGIYCYLRDNKGGVNTVSSYYTLLNNDRLQEFNVDCVTAQDYMLLKHKLDRGVYSSVDTYQQNWFHVDDFTSEEPLHSAASQDIKLSSGIDLNSEQKWDIYMTTTNRALIHYTFVVTEKKMMIRPGSTTVM